MGDDTKHMIRKV